MKYSMISCLLILTLIFSSSCSKDDDSPSNSGGVDQRGLTDDITDLVPDWILDEMSELGMPINGGDNPPSLEGIYLAQPLILLSSNRESDTPGQLFAPYLVTFSEQDNDSLTVLVDYLNGNESGNGLGGFIVGTDSLFTVFVEVNSMIGTSPASLTHAISGTVTEDGIVDFHLANFMLDNFGNPQGYWIEDGEGRVLHDSDGMSERQ